MTDQLSLLTAKSTQQQQLIEDDGKEGLEFQETVLRQNDSFSNKGLVNDIVSEQKTQGRKAFGHNSKVRIDKENSASPATTKIQDQLGVQDLRAFKNAINFLPKNNSLLHQNLEKVEEIDHFDEF